MQMRLHDIVKAWVLDLVFVQPQTHVDVKMEEDHFMSWMNDDDINLPSLQSLEELENLLKQLQQVINFCLTKKKKK